MKIGSKTIYGALTGIGLCIASIVMGVAVGHTRISSFLRANPGTAPGETEMNVPILLFALVGLGLLAVFTAIGAYLDRATAAIATKTECQPDAPHEHAS